jgi:hypothetical protein
MGDFQARRRSLNLIGYEGATMIAVSGLDMAMWDALAKAAEMPLAVLLGGTVGAVPAYNSNGLWLIDVAQLESEAAELVAEGGFRGLKLRLGRDRLSDDLAAIREVRKGEVACPFVFPSAEASWRGNASAGVNQAAIAHSGEAAVRAVYAKSDHAHRRVDGSIRYNNIFLWVAGERP